MKKIDAVEMIGRSLKIPADGLRLWDDVNQKSYFLKPINCGNFRFYNCSNSGQIYVLAAPFGTFICPGFLGIKLLLEEIGFEKVGNDVIAVPYSSSIKPSFLSNDFAIKKTDGARSKALSVFIEDWTALLNAKYD